MKMNQRKAGVLLQYTQMALSIVISLIYTPVMLNILGQGEYGIYNLAASIISYLSILSLGLGASYIRFYSRYRAKDDTQAIANLNGMFLSVFLVIAAVAAAAGVYLSFQAERFFTQGYTSRDLQTIKILMLFSTVNLALSFPTSVFGSYISSQERFVFQKLLSIGKTVVGPMLTLPVLLLGFGSVGMVVVTTTISITVDLIQIIFCLTKLGMRFSFGHFDFSLLREIAGFSFFIALNQIIDQLNLNVDKVILAKMVSKEAVAVYSVAFQLHAMYMSFSTSISSVFVPKVNRMIAEDPSDLNDRLTALFIRTGRIQYSLMMLILTGFIFFGEYFIEFWAGEEYGLSYAIALLLFIPGILPLTQNVGIEIQRAKNKHQFRSLVYFVMAVSNVIISIVLCRAFGTIGTAMGTAISTLLGNCLIMNLYYHKVIGINIIKFLCELAQMTRGLIVPLLFGSCILLWMEFGSMLQYVGMILIYSLLYGICLWCFSLNEYEKSLAWSILKAKSKYRH